MPEIIPIKPLDDKIVVMGMSCAGKTTFANLLTDHTHYCFDAMFHWHLVETLGLSIQANLQFVQRSCIAERYVLDGWHLSDKEGRYLPDGAKVYVVVAPYRNIIAQYRVPVVRLDEHYHMFVKWYEDIEYPAFGARYFLNACDFTEITEKQFYFLLST